MLEFRNVSFSFAGRRGDVDVLRDISFTCGEDEIVAVIGPSGCGKSTLLSLASGLRTPSSGEVLLDGKRVTGSSPLIGMLFQQSTLLPWRSVAENVELGLELRGEPKKKRRAAALGLINQYGLAGFERKYPHALSGGMQKRAALAQTLALNPEVLLLDEPFAALDEITRFRLNNDLLALWRSLRKTVIFVTHSVFESVYLSQRVLVMTARPGRIAAEIGIETTEPRGEDFRTSADYAGYCRRVSNALAPAYSGSSA